MDIILDTNIYEANFSLGGTRWDALEAYLRKTQDQLVIPYVVRHEVLNHYRKELKAAINELKDTLSAFSKVTIKQEHKDLIASIYAIPNRNDAWLQQQQGEFIDKLKSKFNCKVIDEVPALDIRPMVERALNHTRPFNDNGVGFKDAVIWGSLLAYAQSEKKSPIVFISNNSKDFGKKRLFDHLKADAQAVNIDVKYYNSLDEFITENFEPIRDLTIEAKDIDLKELEELMEKQLKENGSSIKELFMERSTQHVYYHSVQHVHDTEISKIENLVVRDVTTDFKYVHATLAGKTSIVCVGDHYSEYVNRFGDFDYEAYQELDQFETECLINITLKLDGHSTTFSELEVTNVVFQKN